MSAAPTTENRPDHDPAVSPDQRQLVLPVQAIMRAMFVGVPTAIRSPISLTTCAVVRKPHRRRSDFALTAVYGIGENVRRHAARHRAAA